MQTIPAISSIKIEDIPEITLASKLNMVRQMDAFVALTGFEKPLVEIPGNLPPTYSLNKYLALFQHAQSDLTKHGKISKAHLIVLEIIMISIVAIALFGVMFSTLHPLAIVGISFALLKTIADLVDRYLIEQMGHVSFYPVRGYCNYFLKNLIPIGVPIHHLMQNTKPGREAEVQRTREIFERKLSAAINFSKSPEAGALLKEFDNRINRHKGLPSSLDAEAYRLAEKAFMELCDAKEQCEACIKYFKSFQIV